MRSLVSLTSFCIFLAWNAPSHAQQAASPVVASPVVEREVASGQTFVGTVLPLKRAAIGSAIDGRVIEFPVNEGDRVKKGQTLAQLLTDTIELELAAAEAQLELRKQELRELENGTRPDEIAQAKAKMLAAQAGMENLQSKYSRARVLFNERKAVTPDQLEEARSAAAAAEQDYLQSQAAYRLALDGPREETIAQARARMLSQQALVDQLKSRIRKHTIISRFDGYVVAEHTEVGQWVSRGDLVAEVIALDEVDVEAHVLEAHIPHIHLGMSARVEVPALPVEAFTGTVEIVIPKGDYRSRTFPVKVRMKNPLDEAGGGLPVLKAGMLARVTLPTGPTERALLVPKDALVLGGAQPLVYVFEGKFPNSAGQGNELASPIPGTVKPVPVELGVADGTLIRVRGEVKKGQYVVVRGNERLRPNQGVQVTQILPPETGAAKAADSEIVAEE